jgi:hypothetical protein
VFVSKASVSPGLEVPELGSTADVLGFLRPMSQGAETWLSLTPQQQFAHLAACPAVKMVPFLESLEASGLRPEMRLWNQALRDVAQSIRVNLELLENIVEKIWRKGIIQMLVHTRVSCICVERGINSLGLLKSTMV